MLRLVVGIACVGAVLARTPQVVTQLSSRTPDGDGTHIVIKDALLPYLQNIAIGSGAQWDTAAMTGRKMIDSGQAATDFRTGLAFLTGPAASTIQSRADALTRTLAGRTFVYLHTFSPLSIWDGDTPDHRTLLIGPIGVDTVFNTLRSTTRTRASTIATSQALPAMADVAAALAKEDAAVIPRIAAIVTYGSKNFGVRDRDDVLNLQAETVVLIVPLPMMQAFHSGAVTEDEIIAKAEAYLRDRDGGVLKRVQLSIQ